MQLKIPPQLKRLGLAFAVFISLFLVVRNSLVPDTFGQYGFYRGASLEEIAESPPKFTGQAGCLDCHMDIYELKQQDVHKTISCETCHGPGKLHSESAEASQIQKPTERESCGICHSRNAARPGAVILQIDLKEHNIDKKCIECHNPHKPWEMKE